MRPEPEASAARWAGRCLRILDAMARICHDGTPCGGGSLRVFASTEVNTKAPLPWAVRVLAFVLW